MGEIVDLINPVPRANIYSKHGHGMWAFWQQMKIANGEPLRNGWHDRFSQFIAENTSGPYTGKVHLHAFYDKERKVVYWKVTDKSSVCKEPGRCVIAEVRLLGQVGK